MNDAMLNAELVRQCYAQMATVPPNVQDQERCLALQRTACEVQRGCVRSGKPAPNGVAGASGSRP
jgi:hypothetical protein